MLITVLKYPNKRIKSYEQQQPETVHCLLMAGYCELGPLSTGTDGTVKPQRPHSKHKLTTSFFYT